MPDTRYLVITDLDGTLLDHHTYQWQAAQPALDWLQEKQIPVVINTSKTRAEVIELQHALNINAPAIVENGSAIFLPKTLITSLQNADWQENQSSYFRVLGKTRQHILERLHELRDKNNWKFEGFADWSVEQIVDATRLPTEDAKRASAREYSEALSWFGDDNSLQAFQTQLREEGFQVLRGGRFIHVLGQSNKGLASLVLKDFYAQQWHTLASTIILGDGPNDRDMLEVADIPVAVKSPVNDFPEINHASVFYTHAFGPEGWNEAISHFKTSII